MKHRREYYGHKGVLTTHLVEQVEPVDVILMENKLNELTGAVQVDGFQLTRLR